MSDLISREALKKDIDFQYICKCCHNVNGNVCDICHISEIEKKIDNAPTVTDRTEEVLSLQNTIAKLVEGIAENTRPQGKWIEHYSKEMSEKGYFLCSKCKCGFQRFERGVRHSDLPWIDGQKYELHCIDNFCPNCGADMRKGGAE